MTNEKIEMIQSRIEIQKVSLEEAQERLNLTDNQREEAEEELERRENEVNNEEDEFALGGLYKELHQYIKRLEEQQEMIAQIKSELNFLEMMLLIK